MSEYSKQDYEHMALAGEYEIGFRGEAELCVISNDMIDVSLWTAWNPDTDLADNYRLLIDAGISITMLSDCCWCTHEWLDIDMPVEYFKDHNNDKEKATMKAVCDVAIQVGKTMGGKE